LSRLPRLSIIIPTLNEELTITGLLRSLAQQSHISDCEVLVIDAESQDETATLADAFPFVEVISSKPGLVQQMNLGAERASGESLWFLHADTTLPDPGTVGAILRALDDPAVVGGACRFHLRGDDLYFHMINVLVNARARLLRRPYGDQGIFVRRDIFRRLGGFRQLPRCVDLEFVLRLRRMGQFVILRPRVSTSARTWRRHGKVRTTAYHVAEWLGFEWNRATGKLAEE